MLQKKIKLGFSNWCKGLPKEGYHFYQVLSKFFNLEVTDNPDFLIYLGRKNRNYLQYDCTRILFENEYSMPNFGLCDYALTFHYLNDPRHLRLPFYFTETNVTDLIKTESAESLLAEKKKFCNFVFSNGSRHSQFRVEFFKQLHARKHVDAGGKLLNNIGKRVDNKIEFCRPYKFTIATENKACVGYTTEKIVNAMQSRTVPIYWGNLAINDDFNPKSFINVQKFPSTEAAIDHILEVDANDELYLEYAREPYFYNNTPNEYLNEERLATFFDHIFSNPRPKKRIFFPIRNFVDKYR